MEVDVVASKARPIDSTARQKAQALGAAEEAGIHDEAPTVAASDFGRILLNAPSQRALRKVKVVTLVDRVIGGGGGERVAAAVAAALDPERFDRTLCVTRPSPRDPLDELRAAGVTVIELDRRRRLQPLAWLPLTSHARRHGVDILHSHKFGSNAWAAVVARLIGARVLVTHEHSWSFTGDRRRMLIDRYVIAPRAAAMVAVSSLDARRMVEIERLPAGKVRVIPNGIVTPRVTDRLSLRRELSVDPAVPVVGFVGSLRPEKRVDLVLDAAARLLRERRLHVALVGSGPEEPALREQVRAAGIADSVTFLGFRSDATTLAAGFDVAVLASDREGAPLTILEYMALGRAVVATRVGGIPELVEDGRDAVLVPPGDAAALAGAIGRLLDDPAERLRLGSAASARQTEKYSFDEMTRQVESLYLELLGCTEELEGS
jgi:glycosyltransferase involved in cell wall biosynthesis